MRAPADGHCCQKFLARESFWTLLLRSLLLPASREEPSTTETARTEQRRRPIKREHKKRVGWHPLPDDGSLPSLRVSATRLLATLQLQAQRSPVMEHYNAALRNLLNSRATDLLSLNVAEPEQHYRAALALVRGYSLLHECQVLVPALAATRAHTAGELAQYLVDSVRFFSRPLWMERDNPV